MALPRSADARLFYRAAEHRYDDARLLLAGGRTTGAIYLGGYAVECTLRALILASLPKKECETVPQRFKGSLAHDYHWLRQMHRHYAKTEMPRSIVRHFTRVESWSTHLRYSPGIVKEKTAEEFIESVAEVVNWAKGRM